MGRGGRRGRAARWLAAGAALLAGAGAGGETGAFPAAAAGGGGGRLSGARAWVARHAGVALEGAVLGEAGGEADLGVFAAAGGLGEGEPYLTVPWDLVLGPHSAPAGSGLARCFADLEARYGQDSKTQLILLLLHERFAAAGASQWAEYLDALPQAFTTPLYWGPGALRELQGSHALAMAIEEQARVRALHKGLSRRVFADWPGLFPPAATSLEAVSWAWSIVHSRASHVPGKGRLLVPLADYIRDSGGPVAGGGASPAPGAEAEAAAAPAGFVEHDPAVGAAVVYSKRAYRGGEEIREDYGAWTMVDLMQQAGYLPESRTGDCITLRVDERLAPASAHLDPQRLKALLEARGFDLPWHACLRPGARAPLRRFVQFGALLEAEEAGRFSEGAEEVVVGAGAGADAGETRAPAPERHRELLLEVLEGAQAQYNATTVEEDEAMLASYMVLPGGDGGERELLQVRLATEFRLREKAVLRQLVDNLREATSLSEWVEAAG